MRQNLRRIVLLSGLLVAGGFFQTASGDDAASVWDMKKLSEPPKVYNAPQVEGSGVRGMYYEGLPYKGKPTRVFAWYGAPATTEGKKLPAMVLVHGGGGSAFIYWVKLWNSRGYAAIAMDTCGCLPGSDKGGGVKRPRHEFGGPPGWGGFDQIDQPIEDQWTYHAVADAILAHSLIRSFPEVDPDRVGITGISWGGYLTCITSGVDSRFQCAVPVYGCGYLGENSVWLPEFKKMGPEKAAKWLKLWDPSRYLQNAKMPMLWVDGTNDFAYPPDSLQKSYRQPLGPRTLAVGVPMPHAHGGAGENPKEIHVFADSIFNGGKHLPKLGQQGREGNTAWTQFEADLPVEKAELNYTKDSGKWQQRKWETTAATLAAGKASAAIPNGAMVYYFNLTDRSGAFASSEHVEITAK